MSDLQDALAAAVDALAQLGKQYCLVGGLAVSARCEPRLTRDADMAVVVSGDDDAEQLVHGLRAHGYELAALVEQEAVGRIATVRLVPRGDPYGLVTDLLFASSGIEPEVVADAEELEVVAGLILPVASVGHLIALKLLARDDRRRPLDADDLKNLAEVASESDWAVADRAVGLIVQRGFARERDLVQMLRDLRQNGAY